MKAIVALNVLLMNVALAQTSPLSGYQYTDIKSMEKASEIWNSMKKRELKKSSECFNRAHTWAYDMWKDFGVSSRKILIHFSYKYNKELSSKWGYHIAPMISVNGIDYVMDRKYFDTPVTVDVWQAYFVEYATKKLEKERLDIVSKIKTNRTKIERRRRDGTGLFQSSPKALIKENRELEKELKYFQVTENEPAKISCANIEHIEQSDYRPFNEWCYLQKVSMYYWGYPQLRLLNYGSTNIPNKSDLVSSRVSGEKYQTTDWDMDQLWVARKEAFDEAEKLWPYEYAVSRRR